MDSRRGGKSSAIVRARLQAERQKAMSVSRIMFLVSCLLAAAIVVVYICILGSAKVKNQNIDDLNTRIAAEQNRRQNLEIALSRRGDIELIKSKAVDELGMVLPGSWSVRVMAVSGEMNTAGQAVYSVAAQPEDTP